MRKAIKSTLKQVNSKITELTLRKTYLILSKPVVKNLTDETARELNKELWNILNTHLGQIRIGQLLSIMDFYADVKVKKFKEKSKAQE